MISSLICLLFGLLTVIAQDFENELSAVPIQNPKPVFLVHGLLFPAVFYEYLESKIKEHNPRRIIINSEAYDDFDSIIPLREQIDGTLGQQFRNFSDEHPDGIHVIGVIVEPAGVSMIFPGATPSPRSCLGDFWKRHSQGALLCRLLIQSYPKHNVRNYISIAGPHGGVYGFPLLLEQLQPLAQFPPALALATAFYYTPEAQETLSTANYWRDPTEPEEYLRYNTALPYYNNELLSDKSESYKQAILKLDNFITIFGPNDGSIYPWESSDFSYYNRFLEIVNITQWPIYTEDRLGIRTLDEEGRFIRCIVPHVEHLDWLYNDAVIDNYILPYLN